MKIKELWQLEHEATVGRDRMTGISNRFGRLVETALLGVALVALVYFGYSGFVSPTLYDAMADLTLKMITALGVRP